MANLVNYLANGIELYIDQETGESFASIRGYARLSGKAESTIHERIGVRKTPTKTAEVQTPGGLQGVRLITEDSIVEWLPADNLTMAKSMLKLGVRKFIHALAGYEHKQEQPKQLMPTHAEALRGWADALEKIEVLAPKAAFAETYIDRDGLTLIGHFAKDLGIPGLGRNNLFKWLRQQRVLQKNNEPYQCWVETGYFVLKPSGKKLNEREVYTTMLTAEGVKWLTEFCSKNYR